jgi:hypothetical protein
MPTGQQFEFRRVSAQPSFAFAEVERKLALRQYSLAKRFSRPGRRLLRGPRLAVSPAIGFAGEGEGFIRFRLVENEQRIAQAVRGIRGAIFSGAADSTRRDRTYRSRLDQTSV